jgi:hypothetical protein
MAEQRFHGDTAAVPLAVPPGQAEQIIFNHALGNRLNRGEFERVPLASA